jgi:hypothetical protein
MPEVKAINKAQINTGATKWRIQYPMLEQAETGWKETK